MSNCGRWAVTFCANPFLSESNPTVLRSCDDRWNHLFLLHICRRHSSTGQMTLGQDCASHFCEPKGGREVDQTWELSATVSPAQVNLNQFQPLHTDVKHIPGTHDLWILSHRTKYTIVGSSIVHCRCPSGLCFSASAHCRAICGWTDWDFSPRRVACIAWFRWPGMDTTLTLDGAVRCEQNVHSCAVHYAHNVRPQFEIRLRDGDILLSHGQQWRSSAALRVRWIVATLSSYDWCLCPTKKIRENSFIKILWSLQPLR